MYNEPIDKYDDVILKMPISLDSGALKELLEMRERHFEEQRKIDEEWEQFMNKVEIKDTNNTFVLGRIDRSLQSILEKLSK